MTKEKAEQIIREHGNGTEAIIISYHDEKDGCMVDCKLAQPYKNFLGKTIESFSAFIDNHGEVTIVPE